jgi:hypothetical protein
MDYLFLAVETLFSNNGGAALCTEEVFLARARILLLAMYRSRGGFPHVDGVS